MSLNWKHMLRDDFPDDDKLKVVTDMLRDATAQLEDVTNQMQSLEIRKQKLEESIDIFRGIRAPIRRLPDDILREIFVHCLPVNCRAVMDGTEAPLLLGQVCGAWRELAWGYPRLWIELHIVVLPLLTKNTVQEDMVSEWFGRSGALPLSWSIAISHSNHHRASEHFQGYLSSYTGAVPSMLRCLAKYASRWQTVSLQGTALCFDILNRTGINAFPSLQNVTIRNRVSYNIDPSILEPIHSDIRPQYVEIESYKWFRTSPITAIVLTDLQCDPLTLPLPWESLTTLGLKNFRRAIGGQAEDNILRPATALAILKLCPNLKVCGIDIKEINGTVPVSTDVVSLLSLHSLTINFSTESASVTTSFFSHLNIPNLKTFMYTEGRLFDIDNQMNNPDTVNVWTLPMACIKGFPVLESVSLLIWIDTASQDAMKNYLQSIPSLKRRQLRNICSVNPWWTTVRSSRDDQGFHLLRVLADEPSTFCPKLESFDAVVQAPATAELTSIFIKLFESRASTLTKLRIRFVTTVMETEDEARFMRFKKMHPRVKCTFHFPRAPLPEFSPMHGISEDVLDGSDWVSLLDSD